MSVSAFPYGVYAPGGPRAEFNLSIDLNLGFSSPAYAGVRIDNSGEHFTYSATGILESVGDWLLRGGTDEVWVQMVVSSGSWNDANAGSGRLACTSDRIWRLSTTGAEESCTFTMYFYDAAIGGNELDNTGLLTFSAEVLGGGI